MKKLISSFADSLLSKEQMKKVKGGMCNVYFDTQDGGEASITVRLGVDQNQAVAYADSKMGGTINGSSKITGYRVDCNQQ